MAVPRNRQSNHRRKQRRAHNALAAAGTTPCESCGANKMPHRICPSCGSYRGRTYRSQTETAE